MSSLKKYRKLKYLGKGSYGAALLVELRADPAQKFVIKEIVIGHLKPAEQQAAKNEAEVLHQMNHSNITTYIESFVENSKLYIVMEFADGGDLSSAVQKRKNEGKPWTEDEVMRIFVQICLALRHVHNANILHRDLKSQNIFLTQKGMVKLGDFGIAKVLDASDDQARTQIGTPYYLSPEICESKPYGRKSDVWSLGVILYELLALEMPFQANSLPALVHRIVSAEPAYTKLDAQYSVEIVTLCKQLLLKSCDDRPSLNSIVRSDFIKGHISRLLSYTLKSGTGGVAEVVRAGDLSDDLDADEAERRIEVARNQQRQLVQAAAQQPMGIAGGGSAATERERRREEEREKLRKFRQDLVRKKEEPRAVSPGPNPFQRGGPGAQRALSPASQGRGSARSLAEVHAERARSNPTAVVRAAPTPAPQVTPGGNGSYESVARREYFANRAAAMAVKAKVEAYERDRPGAAATGAATGTQTPTLQQPAVAPVRRPSDPSMEDADPETRIALLRAQRERDRDREVQMKEQQIKQAIEANREERKRLEAMKQGSERAAVAFDIDVQSAPAPRAQRVPSSRDLAPVASAHETPSTADIETASGKRRSWGPRVEVNDILAAKGLARRDSQPRRDSGAGLLDEDEAEADSQQVLHRIQAKRQSQLDMRNQAKEVLGRLREQRLKEQQAGGPGGAKQRLGVKPMVSPVQRAEGVARPVSPMRQRLMEIMQQVEIAKESVQKAMVGNDERGRRRENGPSEQEVKAKREQAAPQRDVSNRPRLTAAALHVPDEAAEVEDELDDTLTTWLQHQKRSVTMRRKGSKHASDEVEDDPDVVVYSPSSLEATEAVNKLAAYQQRGESKDVDSDSLLGVDVRPRSEGKEADEDGTTKDDVEVVELQCMLAKALMDDDDDDGGEGIDD